MAAAKNLEISVEEPYVGWLRCEVPGEKPFYKTPFPRTVIRDQRKLLDYLEKEKANGKSLDVDPTKFSFKRRLGLKTKKKQKNVADLTLPVSKDINEVTKCSVSSSADILDRLSRDGTVVNHRQLLARAASSVDGFREATGVNGNTTSICQVQKKVSNATNMRELVAIIGECESLAGPLMLMLADICLSEICCIDVRHGPLVEFPPSINENIYCKTIDFGLRKCPNLMSFVINLVVRRSDPVLPSDVLKIATLFSSICYLGKIFKKTEGKLVTLEKRLLFLNEGLSVTFQQGAFLQQIDLFSTQI